MPARVPDPPLGEPIVTLPPILRLPPISAPAPKPWIDWWQALADRLSQTADRLRMLELVGQSGSIGLTPIPLGTIAAGLYRVSYYVRVTQPAGTSSALQVTIGWTDGGVSMSAPGASLTGNLPTTHETRTLVIRSDANGPITYSTSYSSSGSPAMQYALRLVVEAL